MQPVSLGSDIGDVHSCWGFKPTTVRKPEKRKNTGEETKKGLKTTPVVRPFVSTSPINPWPLPSRLLLGTVSSPPPCRSIHPAEACPNVQPCGNLSLARGIKQACLDVRAHFLPPLAPFGRDKTRTKMIHAEKQRKARHLRFFPKESSAKDPFDDSQPRIVCGFCDVMCFPALLLFSLSLHACRLSPAYLHRYSRSNNSRSNNPGWTQATPAKENATPIHIGTRVEHSMSPFTISDRTGIIPSRLRTAPSFSLPSYSLNPFQPSSYTLRGSDNANAVPLAIPSARYRELPRKRGR
ncbi:hypothetical protein LZ32DRAFT_75330 [Colletotrichum eremochloae]|nr:hypothetical protein LZ32DRAFT_75330 [Colletotrichum eremochloae]